MSAQTKTKVAWGFYPLQPRLPPGASRASPSRGYRASAKPILGPAWSFCISGIVVQAWHRLPCPVGQSRSGCCAHASHISFVCLVWIAVFVGILVFGLKFLLSIVRIHVCRMCVVGLQGIVDVLVHISLDGFVVPRQFRSIWRFSVVTRLRCPQTRKIRSMSCCRHSQEPLARSTRFAKLILFLAVPRHGAAIRVLLQPPLLLSQQLWEEM